MDRAISVISTEVIKWIANTYKLNRSPIFYYCTDSHTVGFITNSINRAGRVIFIFIRNTKLVVTTSSNPLLYFFSPIFNFSPFYLSNTWRNIRESHVPSFQLHYSAGRCACLYWCVLSQESLFIRLTFITCQNHGFLICFRTMNLYSVFDWIRVKKPAHYRITP